MKKYLDKKKVRKWLIKHDKVYNTLPERDKYILSEVFVKGKIYSEVARKYKVSQQRIRQIINHSIRKLKYSLGSKINFYKKIK